MLHFVGKKGILQVQKYVVFFWHFLLILALLFGKQTANQHLTWIIHESRLPQIEGTAHEAVVVHRECAVTQ